MKLINMFDLFLNMLNLIKTDEQTRSPQLFENVSKCILALIGVNMALKHIFCHKNEAIFALSSNLDRDIWIDNEKGLRTRF